MESVIPGRLTGSEIHGFHTLRDLDVLTIMEEAKTRWLRPNEIHAILCNHKYFTISVKPVNLPQSGRIILYDRKMLRNFRKDGHNWKKKNDGKTVKEAHEHLKVGNIERIHVYYAHGQDNPTFVRRCYWLLDKSYEHIVLVHYRETQESQGSPATPVNSHSSSISDPSAPGLILDEFDSAANKTFFRGDKELSVPADNMTIRTHQMRLHELNTLEWDELVADDPNSQSANDGGPGRNSYIQIGSINDGLFAEAPGFGILGDSVSMMGVPVNSAKDFTGGSCNPADILVNDGLQSQDSFGRWVNSVVTDSPGSVDDALLEPSVSPSQVSSTSSAVDNPQCWGPEHIFSITDISPAWAYSTDKTKILVTGFFHDGSHNLVKSNLFCVCGDLCVPAEVVQVGVYRCLVSPHSPGIVNFYLSLDGRKPISQVLNFEYRTPVRLEPVGSPEDKLKLEDFQVQMRLASLLFSTSKCIDIASNKVSPNALKEGKKFASRTANLVKNWEYLLKSIDSDKVSCTQAKDLAFDLMVKSRLRDWLLERVVGGFKTSEYDVKGQVVIHLCAILGYTWSVQLFLWSGLSLDFRDKFGWTALHWAAYCGREKMVAKLLSAGAKPNLVTDPTTRNPAGCTASDLASRQGYEGIGAYLAEKGLVQQFQDMTVAGNASGSLHASANDAATTDNLTEDEIYLKDTLAAYRTAADAAARIQSAFREHSLKIRTQQIEIMSPEDEARSIIAAIKIQHAFRNYESRKQMLAAARIQHRFRAWRMRKEFLNMRHQVIKIQAAFRGFQVRRQYRKICWSVGVVEKAILRWRLKRKGFRGFHVEPAEPIGDGTQESDTEEDFFRISRRQAEDRVERAVVSVQTMFRSKKAQEEYRRMKLAYGEAQLEYDQLLNSEDMES